MSDVRHERRFRDFRGTSAYPPRLAVKADIPDRQVRAITGREQMQQSQCYSITSSARASSVGGTLRPSVFAVLRLTIRVKTDGNWTGSSPGVSPRKILST